MIFDILANLEMYQGVLPELKTIAEAMDHDDVYELPAGSYTTPDPKVSYKVVAQGTSVGKMPFQFHKDHTIVEIVLSGKELASTSWRELCSSGGTYSKETDTGILNAEPLSVIQAAQGRFIVFFSGEPYKSGVSDGAEDSVRKVIFTIKEDL